MYQFHKFVPFKSSGIEHWAFGWMTIWRNYMS